MPSVDGNKKSYSSSRSSKQKKSTTRSQILLGICRRSESNESFVLKLLKYFSMLRPAATSGMKCAVASRLDTQPLANS